MSNPTIGRQRLASQQASTPQTDDPAAVVRHLGAVQAQDYLGALWAVGLRTRGAREATVERAIAEARIVRTWPMRGTIHFVAPEDARWMLALLTPRVVRGSQARLRELQLDAATLSASEQVIGAALAGGRQLTRPQIYAELGRAGIAAAGSRGLHILSQLSMAGLLCFGPRAGKQPTFVLLDEWLPPAAPLVGDEALAALALRYFTSHGPAGVQDFAWWAGLPLGDARAGLAAVAEQLEQLPGDAGPLFAAPGGAEAAEEAERTLLLPPFDEFLIAYRDRSATLDPRYSQQVVPGGNGVFYPIVVRGGRVAGTWRRTLRARGAELSFHPFEPADDDLAQAAADASQQYRQFLGNHPAKEA